MTDIVDKKMAFLKQSIRGSFLRNRELFKGVRKLVDDMNKIMKLEEDVQDAEKKGNVDAILKDFKKECESIDDFEEHLGGTMEILLLNAHKMKEEFRNMKVESAQLENEGFNADDITRYKARLEEETKKLNEILGKIAGIAASVERE